jgi:hypothetical protein
LVALTRLENHEILKRHHATLCAVCYAKHYDESGDKLHCPFFPTARTKAHVQIEYCSRLMREKPSSVGAMASMNCDGERYLCRVSALCL